MGSEMCIRDRYFTPPVLENRKASTDCSVNAFVSFDTTIIAQVSLLKRANLSCSLLICPVGCYALLVGGCSGRVMCHQVGGLVAEVLGNTYIV